MTEQRPQETNPPPSIGPLGTDILGLVPLGAFVPMPTLPNPETK